MGKDGESEEQAGEANKRRRLVRSFPASTFEEPLEFAKTILEFGSGQPVRRLSIFDHMGKSPESGASRQLITNASRYGLIEGSYAAEQLRLTDDGLKAANEDLPPRERQRARIKLAIEDIPAFKQLYDRFVGNKLPAKAALIDAAKQADLSQDAAEEATDTFIVNLRFVGLLQTLSGAEWIVTIDHYLDMLPASNPTILEPGAPIVIKKEQQLSLPDASQLESICFYITPIGVDGSEERRHSDLFLGSIVEPALDTFRLNVIRADAIDKPGIISKQVIDHLVRARLVIVDLSFHNPNVFYELAIRHMLRRPVVQIIRRSDKIPFDINQMRTVVIDTTDIYSLVPKIETYRAEIANQVRRALEDPDSADNPISLYYPTLRAALN
jgi:hypothetical protein